MSIYNRWGDTVEIQFNCGQHRPMGSKYSSSLVLASHEDGRKAFYFIDSLKSPNTLQHIEEVAFSKPKVKLSRKDLRRAIQEAS